MKTHRVVIAQKLKDLLIASGFKPGRRRTFTKGRLKVTLKDLVMLTEVELETPIVTEVGNRIYTERYRRMTSAYYSMMDNDIWKSPVHYFGQWMKDYETLRNVGTPKQETEK